MQTLILEGLKFEQYKKKTSLLSEIKKVWSVHLDIG